MAKVVDFPAKAAIKDAKAGWTVRLKSGGALMTVEYVHDSHVHVVWMEDTSGVMRDSFHHACLEVSSAEETGDDDD